MENDEVRTKILHLVDMHCLCLAVFLKNGAGLEDKYFKRC